MAAELFRKSCDAGDEKACSDLGFHYDNGEGVPKDRARAAQLYQKACDAGAADGCFNLAALYGRGQGVLASGALAAESYYKAGLAFLKNGKKAGALLCVERIQNLTKVLGLTVPNASLVAALLRAAHEEGDATEKAPTDGAPADRAAPKAFGTGWVVWGDHVVTNHHVVSGAKRVRVALAGGVSLGARVVVSDATNDLVLLKPEAGGQLPPSLPLAAQAPRSGETVFTIGHPCPTLLGSEAKVTDGVISAASGLGNDPRLLQVSVPIQPGNSGGPLLNMRGQVVGIVISKLNAAEVFRCSGDLPENVGYAIKLAYLMPLLPAQPPAPAAPSATPAQGLADLVARVRPSIVLVVAE